MYKVFITQRGIKAPSGLERTVKKAARASAKLEGKKGGVSLLLTDDENIRRLNREFRDNDTTTDVLSFPMFGYLTIARTRSAISASWQRRAR